MKRISLVLVLAPLAALAVTLAGCDLLTSTPDPPGSPATLVADARSQTSVLLTWNAPSGGGEVGGYEVERASGSDFARVASPAAGVTTYSDTGLESNRRYVYRVRACNDGGCSEYSSTADVRTFGVLEVTTTSLPDGIEGQPYTAGLDATGAGTSFEWDLVAGALPAGLTLDGETGIISGTPTTIETAQFTVRATSIDGQTADAALELAITPPPALTITTTVLPPVVVDGLYDVALEAAGGGQERVWSLASGTLPAGLAIADTGAISGTPTAVDTATFTLRVESLGESDEATVTLAVVPDDPTRFNITPMAVVDIPANIQPHVDSAVARWERAITGELQNALIAAGTFSSSSCGGFGDLTNGTTIDDVIILVNIGPIDGPGQILGQASPCAVRSDGSTDPNIPALGILTLDSQDLSPIAGTETLTSIVFHEIGHVLGYGSLWSLFDLVDESVEDDPRYTGGGAVAEYSDLGGAGDVPLANTGGDGTRLVHWREADFDTEIMTGFSEPVGVPQPLSEVTIASMEDLGYTVDRTEADPYSLPAASLAWTTAGTLGYDRVLDLPILVIDPDGTLRSTLTPTSR